MMVENYEDRNRWLVNISDSSKGGRVVVLVIQLVAYVVVGMMAVIPSSSYLLIHYRIEVVVYPFQWSCMSE
jgi:hypothetical protein